MTPAEPEVVESPQDKTVIKSPEDKRLYRHLKLPNGLCVILISDPHMATKKARYDQEHAVNVACKSCFRGWL